MKGFGRVLIVLLLAISHFSSGSTVWANVLLLCSIFLLSIVAVIAFFTNKKLLKVSIPEILFSIFTIYLFIFNAINGSFGGNERLFNYLIILLSYFTFAFIYNHDRDILRYIIYGLVTGFVIELTIGYSQLLGIIPNTNSEFILGGLLGNPGAYAGYLSIVSILLLTIILFDKKLFNSENYQYLIVFSLFISASLIILSNSRGAWIALFTGTIFFLNIRYHLMLRVKKYLKTATAKMLTGITILFAIAFISLALYHYKKESAFGRLLIWKISSKMVYEKPAFGMGFGAFEANYGKVQAAYFLSGNSTENEKMVADYVTCAYNEFLEILIESGITGLLLFLAILYFALVKRYYKYSSGYHIASKTSLIALLILSMVSYPFRIMPNLLLFIICLFIIFRTGQYKTITIPVKFCKTLVLIWIIAISSLVYWSSMIIYGKYHFLNGYKEILNNDIDNGISNYNKAYSFLSDNGNFMFYYGSALYLKHDYSGSIKYLKKATYLRSDPNAYITLGNSLQKLKRYTEAEHTYQIASNITPAKLYPKYLLAKLYVEMQQNDKAMNMAKEIINSKEKISTMAGMEIKEEMRGLILRFNKLHH